MSPPRFSSLLWIVCENHGYHQTADLLSHQRLAREGAVLTNYFSITHPSGPNYRSMAAGRYFTSDEILAEEHPTFASAAGLPATVWNYKGTPAHRHNPLWDLKTPHETTDALDLESLPDRCVVYVGMDDNNNAHDAPLEVADKNLLELLDRLTASGWFNRPVGELFPALFVVWDEAYTLSNQVFAAFFGQGIKPGATSGARLNHFSFCRLCCENFGVAPLGHSGDAARIDGIFVKSDP
jgi:hypothetical protein